MKLKRKLHKSHKFKRNYSNTGFMSYTSLEVETTPHSVVRKRNKMTCGQFNDYGASFPKRKLV